MTRRRVPMTRRRVPVTPRQVPVTPRQVPVTPRQVPVTHSQMMPPVMGQSLSRQSRTPGRGHLAKARLTRSLRRLLAYRAP